MLAEVAAERVKEYVYCPEEKERFFACALTAATMVLSGLWAASSSASSCQYTTKTRLNLLDARREGEKGRGGMALLTLAQGLHCCDLRRLFIGILAVHLACLVLSHESLA